MNGDNYHYFSLLRKLDDWLPWPRRLSCARRPLPQIAFTQIGGLVLNWLPYALVRTFGGRKAAIVAVRFSNRVATVIFSILLSREVAFFLGTSISIWFSAGIFLLVFLVLPLVGRGSVLFNLFNKRHLFTQENSNEITRAYATETTTPILLGAIVLGFQTSYSEDLLFVYLVAIFLTSFMSSVYAPAFVAYLFFLFALYLGNGMYGPGLAVAIIGAMGLLVSGRVLRRDPMSSSLIARQLTVKKIFSAVKGIDHRIFLGLFAFQSAVFLFHIAPDRNFSERLPANFIPFLMLAVSATVLVSIFFFISGKLVRLEPIASLLIIKKFRKHYSRTKWVSLRLVPVLLAVQLVVFLPIFAPRTEGHEQLYALFVALLLPVFFSLSMQTYLGRIWIRGWEPIWLVITLSALASSLSERLQERSGLEVFFFMFLFAATIFYFLRQAVYLVKMEGRAISEEKYARLRFSLRSEKGVVFTDDPEIALFHNLYGEKMSALENYSVQEAGYQVHLRNFVACLRAVGWSRQKTVDVLTTNVSYSDWMKYRPLRLSDSKYVLAHAYSLQYWATNREYNSSLVEDGMYEPGTGWTRKFQQLVEEAWNTGGETFEGG